MASEILAVPEECLSDMVEVIRCGLSVLDGVGWPFADPEMPEHLRDWCRDVEEYLNS